jgi:formylglycine-generating enzyme required for sulfatase activity
MVGNLEEWVEDWVPVSTECPGWASFSNDLMCLAGASTTRNGPGALARGGWFLGGPADGPLTVLGSFQPSRSIGFVGFRCAR